MVPIIHPRGTGGLGGTPELFPCSQGTRSFCLCVHRPLRTNCPGQEPDLESWQVPKKEHPQPPFQKGRGVPSPRGWRADLHQTPWPPLHLALINMPDPGFEPLSLGGTPGLLQRDPLNTASSPAPFSQVAQVSSPQRRSSGNGSKKEGWVRTGPGLQERTVGSALCSPGCEARGHCRSQI